MVTRYALEKLSLWLQSTLEGMRTLFPEVYLRRGVAVNYFSDWPVGVVVDGPNCKAQDVDSIPAQDEIFVLCPGVNYL